MVAYGTVRQKLSMASTLALSGVEC